MRAARKGHLEIVKWLIGVGADVNIKDNDGDTALNLAALYGHLETLKFLIDYGAEIDKEDCLRRAASWGHLDIVRFLAVSGQSRG